MSFVCSLLIVSLFVVKLNAQKTAFNDLYLGADYHYGFLLPEYPFFNYLTNDAVKGFDIKFVKDLKGSKLWERTYNYPSVGLSFYHGSLGNDTVFGKVSSVFPFIKFPLLEKNKILISSGIGVGAAYANEKFDLQQNYYNIAIASHFNIWFQAILEFKYRMNKNISFSAGTAFGHFSNANLAEPNLGLNFWTFYTGTAVCISKQSKRNEGAVSPFKKKNEFALIVAGGGKHTRRFADQFYFAGSVSIEYRRILGYKFATGSGADFFYDASIPDEMKRAGISDVKEIYKIKSGMHFSQELIIGKLSVIIQEGIYLGFKDHLSKHIMYNRGIVRYKLTDHIFVNLAMKTNLQVLDVAELGLGYYFTTFAKSENFF